jgi:hypothetical protein
MEGLKRCRTGHSFFVRLGMAKGKNNSLLKTDGYTK